MASNYRQKVAMNGDNFEQFQIPDGYGFVSVINNTDNVLYIYQERRTGNDPAFALLVVPQYTQQTIPISPGRRDFTVYYVDGGGPSPKYADMIFSVESLQIQGTLGTAISGQVAIISQTAGLLQTADLSLTPEKKLRVVLDDTQHISATVNGGIAINNDGSNPVPVAGAVDVSTLPALPAGTNNIGKVQVTALPALPAGSSNIGSVNVAALPALPAGANNIGSVNVGSMPSVTVGALPALPAGSNNIGSVNVAALPALPAGANNIGSVGIAGTVEVHTASIIKAGSPSNVWSSSTVAAGGDSFYVDCADVTLISAFGRASAATTIKLMVAPDTSGTWYETGVQAVLTAAGDFSLTVQHSGRYFKLVSTAAATITATIAGKQ